jgi:hypothetical protein
MNSLTQLLARENVYLGWIGATAKKFGMNRVKIETSPIADGAIKNPVQQATS